MHLKKTKTMVVSKNKMVAGVNIELNGQRLDRTSVSLYVLRSNNNGRWKV